MRKVRISVEPNRLVWSDSGRFPSCVRSVILGILLCFLCCAAARAQRESKQVLIVLSSIGSDEERNLGALETALRARVPASITFHLAHLVNERDDGEEQWKIYKESQAETFRRMYQNVKMDLIIAISPQALQFTLEYRDKIAPGVPVVFTEVSSREYAGQTWPPGVTGMTVPVTVPETIDLAMRLHPNAKTVAILQGPDWYWIGVAHSQLQHYQVKVVDFIGPASREMLQKVDALPPDTVVLFHLAPSLSSTPEFGAYDLLREVSARFPTYSPWNSICMGYGCVGGAFGMTSDPHYLRTAEIAARVLSGERPENIPVAQYNRIDYTVDWRAVQRWHIPESALPPGTLILYREPTFWERDRKYIIPAIALIVAQALLIASLLWQRYRKRKAEAVLRESEERFRVMADSTPALVWMCDEHGKITYLNERWLAYAGPGKNAGYGDNWLTYIHPDDVKNVLNDLLQALRDQKSFSKEYRLHRNDGAYRWLFDVASPRINGDGTFAGFIGSAIDVTDQKLAQQALEQVSGKLIEAQEKERTRIARDLHDDICQRMALLSMELEQAKGVLKGRVSATQSIDQIRQHCVEIGADVQSLSHQLHSSKLDYLGIAAAIRGFCREFSKQHHVTVDFTDGNVPQHLPKDVSLCLFRVTQEALHNAVKYSGTTHFTVELSATGNTVTLLVSDSGVGFDVENAKTNRGLGLVSMQERVHLVHGQLSVESKPGEGTRVIAVIAISGENGQVPENETAKETASTMSATGP